MKIEGQKNLNSNLYDNITITDKIKVKSNFKFPTLNMNSKFSNDLKKLNDDEQIDKVLNYFLEYSKINGIVENYYHAGKEYMLIAGSRDLKIEGYFKKDQMQKILLKYQKDRINNLIGNDIETIELTTDDNETLYYEYYNLLEEEKRIKIILLSKKRILLPPFERSFLETYLTDIFGNNKMIIDKDYDNNNVWNDMDKFILEGSDKKIKFNRCLLPEINNISINHNKKIDEYNNKYKQLKMEGI